MRGRDDALIAALPPKLAPYSFDSLSQSETEALEASLSDGFGDVGADGYPPHDCFMRRGILWIRN